MPRPESLKDSDVTADAELLDRYLLPMRQGPAADCGEDDALAERGDGVDRVVAGFGHNFG